MKGYIQIYTGNGKGKTTAALGLALRAVGAGKKVFFAQFVKGKPYAEIEAVTKHLPQITIQQYGRGCFIEKAPTEADIQAAQHGLEEIEKTIRTGEHDVVILDEACIALYFKLISLEQLIAAIKAKPEATEIVVTGRYAPKELIECADLVTEMKEVKHYYTQGIEAREGIEY